MKLISELLNLSFYQTSANIVYLVEEGSWFGMIAVSAMFAFVMYWVVWKMNTRAQERKRTEFENWDPEEKERKEQEALEWKLSVRRAIERKNSRD